MISAVLDLPASVILTLPSSVLEPAGPRHSKKTFSADCSTSTSRQSLVPTLWTVSSSSRSENTGWDILAVVISRHQSDLSLYINLQCCQSQ